MCSVFVLQLDLEKPKRITGIITQGAKDFGVVQFVSAFKIAYSDDGQSWSIVKDATKKTDKVSECSLSSVSFFFLYHSWWVVQFGWSDGFGSSYVTAALTVFKCTSSNTLLCQ